LDSQGETPLLVAYSTDVIEVLLSKANINSRNRDGKTILLKSLSERSSDRTDGMSALERSLRIVDLGADTSCIDNDGNSALHHCAKIRGIGTPRGRLLLDKLMKGGADPSPRNLEGQMALHNLDGSVKGDPEAFLELTKSDVNALDSQGRTLFFKIMDQSRFRAVKAVA
jgi:ankyrin repeat protein